MLKEKTKAKDAVCFWCGKPAQYWWPMPVYRYSCCAPHTDCEVYQLMMKHKEECPLPDEYHDIKNISKIKCYGMLHVLYSNKVIQTRYNLDNLKLKYRIQLGKEKCKYCGDTAHHLAGGGGDYFPCCNEKTRKCPGYHDYISKIMKQKYIDHPELLDKMSESLKIAQNRPEVKEKKRESMLILHHGDCEPCKEFQTNFKQAHLNRRGKPYGPRKRRES